VVDLGLEGLNHSMDKYLLNIFTFLLFRGLLFLIYARAIKSFEILGQRLSEICIVTWK
jgi:hypothetical protein